MPRGDGTAADRVHVRSDAPVLLDARGIDLAKVVAKGCEHEKQRLHGAMAQQSGLIQHQHGMAVDVALGVVLGVLWHAAGRRHLGKELLQMPDRLQHGKKDRRLFCLQQRLAGLLIHALAGEVAHIHASAQFDRLLRDAHLKARGELGHAEHAQGVFRESGGVHMAKDAAFEVLAPAPVIDDLAGAYVHEHGVDGEVAPPAGVHC